MPVLGGNGGLGQYLWSIYKCINTTILDNSLILIPRPRWPAQFVAAQGCWIVFFVCVCVYVCVLIHTCRVKQAQGKKEKLFIFMVLGECVTVGVREERLVSLQPKR